MNPTTVHNFDERREEFLSAMHSGEPFEMDKDSWYYWLEVLPPVHYRRMVKLPNGETVNACFGFAEGAELITVFWNVYGRFFGCRTTEVSRA